MATPLWMTPGIFGPLAGAGGNIFGSPQGIQQPQPKPVGWADKLAQGLQNPGAQLGLRILANNRGQGLGQNLGQSFLQMQGEQGQQAQADLQRQLMEAQIAKLRAPQMPEQDNSAPLIVMGPDGKPVYASRRDAVGQTPYLQPGSNAGPSSLQEWDAFQKMSPQEREQYLNMKRQPAAPQLSIINGVPTLVDRINKTTTPLNTLQGEIDAQSQIAGGKASGAAMGEATAAQAAKSPAAASMDYVLNKLETQIDKTSQGGVGGFRGAAGKVFDYKDASRFDNLREQLSTELRTVYRIPGEGTLSDREQQQYGVQLPDRKNEAEVNKAIITDLRERTRLRLQSPIGNQAPASQYTEGQTATNKKTGEKMIYRGGQWVKQ